MRATTGLLGSHWTVLFILNFGFVTLEATHTQLFGQTNKPFTTLFMFVATEADTYIIWPEVFGITRKHQKRIFCILALLILAWRSCLEPVSGSKGAG